MSRARLRVYYGPESRGVATADEVAAHAYAAMMRGKALSIHGALNALLVQGRAYGVSVTIPFN